MERPYRILIIEDSPEDRETYRRCIAEGREQKFQFWETDSAKAGLQACRDVKPDCILLDYQLPDSNGLEFLDRFQAEFIATEFAIVMLTGYGNEAVAVQAMKKGAADYLVKGLNNDVLRPVIDSALETRELRRQVAEQRRQVESLSAERLQLIEELRQHAADLAEANQRKDEFLAMVSHELRTPLSSIIGWAQVLKSGRLKEHDLTEGLEAIERNGKLQSQLIKDLLDVSRIAAGKLHLDIQTIDPVAVINAALENVMPSAKAKGVLISVALDSEAGTIAGDPARLQQVIWNLGINAVKFTPHGGTVHVQLQRVDSQIEITVADTGQGITPQFLPHLFERFSQENMRTTRSHGGLGLGLAIVQQIVELHGGSVRAESAGEGQGATFIVRLPLVAAPALEAFPPQSDVQRAIASAPILTSAALQDAKILVVDDDEDTRKLIKRVLQESHAEVRDAGNLSQALQVLETFQPNVIVSDIAMSNRDGYELIRQIRTRDDSLQKLPAIALTALASEEARQRSLLAGYQLHLGKPVDCNELIAAVASLLGDDA